MLGKKQVVMVHTLAASSVYQLVLLSSNTLQIPVLEVMNLFNIILTTYNNNLLTLYLMRRMLWKQE